ncbi:MAG: hypothetical protein JXA14_12055 [Anaerolineae bacterium]|nr:hypothetical protein [Anaerolineae bacterium]
MEENAVGEKKPAQVQGKRSAEFYEQHIDQVVNIAVSTGQVFKGTLVGVDQYDLILLQDSGLELLLPKGNVVYVHRAPAAKA